MTFAISRAEAPVPELLRTYELLECGHRVAVVHHHTRRAGRIEHAARTSPAGLEVRW